MFYGVAADADITKNRIHRFCEHMTFDQRSQKLLHGSLEVNEGNWGKSPPPIRLMKGYGSVVDSPKHLNVGTPTTLQTIGTTRMLTEGSPAFLHDLLMIRET